MKLKYIIIGTLLLLVYNIGWCSDCFFVDPDNGDDSSWLVNDPNNPLKTIKTALEEASNGDYIYLKEGEFFETRFSADNTDDSGSWDNARNVLININKTITMDHYQTTTPEIVAFNDTYAAGGTYGLVDVMLIDAPGVKIQNIIFDGYHEVQMPVYGEYNLNTHNVIYMTPDADSTQVLYCDFTNFGEEPSANKFYAIVGGGWDSQQDNYLLYPKIKNNTFHGNPFEGAGAHEMYFSRTDSAEVMNNTIHNNGEGIALKLRDRCRKMVFANNAVYGTRGYFLGDNPNDGDEDYSSDTYFYGNTFADDSPSVMGNEYSKPFGPTAGHIIYFKDNNLYIPQTDSKYIHGITYKSNSNDLYYAWNSGTRDSVYVLVNQHAPNPSTGFYGTMGQGFHCQGDMCTTDTYNIYVIYCTQDATGAQLVYKDDIDHVCDSSILLSTVSSPNITITAFASRPGRETFLTALRDTNSSRVRIYESSTTSIQNGTPKLDITFTNADSITAMAYDGTDLVFATYKSGTSKIYTGAIGSLSISTPVATKTGYISAMCFSQGNLVTAVLEGSTQKLYYGTKTNPLPTANSQTLIGKKVIALAGNGTYLYSLVHDNSGGTSRNKIYFTENLSDYDNQTYFFTHWYRDY